MIFINTQLYDVQGNFSLLPEQIRPEIRDYRNIVRRVNRSKTLNQSVYIADNGVTAGDKDINITIISPDETLTDLMDYLFNFHSDFYISMESGFYDVAFESIRYTGGQAALKFLVRDQII